MNLLGPLTLAVAFQAQEDLPPVEVRPIRIGETVSGVLGLEGPPSQRFELALEEGAPVTVSLESFDFDSFLRVETAEGELLAEDDDSGIEKDSRIVLPAARRGDLVIVASSKKGSGEFLLAIQEGEPPKLDSAALLDAAIAWRRTAAERALARKDRESAAAHRLAEGNRRFSLRQFQEARAAYEASLALAREIQDLGREAAATINLGNISVSLGAYEEARQRYEEGLRAARQGGQRHWEANALGNLGSVNNSLGDYAQALESSEQALALSRELRDHALEAKTRKNLGRTYQGLGDPLRALEQFEACLVLARRMGDRGLEARTFGSLGTVHRSLGDYPRAREHHEKHLALARELGDRVEEAVALGNLGNVSQSVGDHARALEYHARSLALDRELGNKPGELASLAGLGNAHEALGDHPRALEHYQSLLALSREMGDRPAEVAALSGLGNVSYSRADYTAAREHYESLLALSRELGDRPGESTTLGNLGSLHHALRDYPRSREYHAQHLALTRELGDREGEARALGNLGNVSCSVGDYGRARELCQQSVDLSREIGDHAQEASTLVMLANICQSLGDPRGARDHFERSLALSRELREREKEASALAGLGLVLAAEGDLARAREHLEESLALSRDLGDRSREAQVLGSLGSVHESLGDSRQAREYYQELFSLSRELGDRAGEANAIGGLGVLDLSTGDHGQALELFGRWLVLSREIGDCEGEARALGNLGVLHLALGDSGSAVEALEEAEKLVEALSAGDLQQADTSGLRDRFAELGKTAQDVTWLRSKQAGEEASIREAAHRWGFAAAGRWKGRTLLEGIAEHRVGTRSARTIELRRARREALEVHAAILERVSQAVHDEKPASAVDDLRAEARAKLAEAARLADQLREVSPRDAALDLALGADPEDLRRAVLGPRELLVEYAEGDEHLYAYVLDGEHLGFLDLGERGVIATELERFLGGIRNIGTLARPSEVARAGRILFERLLAPALATTSEPPECLVVVPCASLAALPFEALVIESASDEPVSFGELVFLLERCEITYGPSSPVLVELASSRPRREDGKILLLADPLYGSKGEEPSGSPPSLAVSMPRGRPDPAELLRLPGTREEALAIASLLAEGGGSELAALRDLRSGSLVEARFELHLGRSASRTRLGGDLRGYSVLHLACHGVVDAELPEHTGIALAPNAGDDGWFSILDALELDLDCEFVVLSACDTAQGAVRAGEGVESLARAFLYAGARGVVASLWQVSDWAAADTMRTFYEAALVRGLPLPRALRETKLMLRRGAVDLGPARIAMGPGVAKEGSAIGLVPEAGHPFFWAPFIHIGLARE